MDTTVSRTAKKLAKWEKPELGDVQMDVSNVKTGYAPGTDADQGPYATSMS